MKKAYIAPSTGVYNINAATIMATSGVQNMSISDVTVDTSTNQLGREENAGSNVWDSEW